jgi:hypothetical protein
MYILLLSIHDVHSDKSQFDVYPNYFLFSLYRCFVILLTGLIQRTFSLIILE